MNLVRHILFKILILCVDSKAFDKQAKGLRRPRYSGLFVHALIFYHAFFCSSGGFPWQLTEFIIGVFLQVLGLPFVAVAQVSLFSKVTAEKTQGEK